MTMCVLFILPVVCVSSFEIGVIRNSLIKTILVDPESLDYVLIDTDHSERTENSQTMDL